MFQHICELWILSCARNEHRIEVTVNLNTFHTTTIETPRTNTPTLVMIQDPIAADCEPLSSKGSTVVVLWLLWGQKTRMNTPTVKKCNYGLRYSFYGVYLRKLIRTLANAACETTDCLSKRQKRTE